MESNTQEPKKQYKCSKCGEDKPPSEFPSGKPIKRSVCLQCRKKRKHEWYLKTRGTEKHLNRTRKNARRHYRRHLKSERARARKYAKQVRNEYPEKMLFAGAKQRAKKKGLKFTIALSDIILARYCPILNIPMVPMRDGNGNWENAPTIDRINPDRGYEKDNIMIISRRANIIKSYGTIDEHRKIANWMEKVIHQQQQAT